jgi:hypothetical protein
MREVGGEGGSRGQGEKWPKQHMHIWINELKKRSIAKKLKVKFISN